MANLPDNVTMGRVKGRFLVAVIDGEDEDDLPEAIPAQGQVIFRPSQSLLPNPSALPAPVTIISGSIKAVLDSEGYLSTPHPVEGDPMYRHVTLIATDGDALAVKDWTWDVEYRLETPTGSPLPVPAHSFTLPSGAELDLTKLVKIPSTPGYGLPQAEAAALRAETVAQSIRDDADAGRFNGTPGPPGKDGKDGRDGAPGVDGTTTTGTRTITIVNQTGGSFQVRRDGNNVTLAISGYTSSSPAGLYNLSTLPSGFRPAFGIVQYSTIAGVPTPQRRITILSNGTIQVYNYAVGDALTGTFTYPTFDAWPTTLPGT